METQQFTKRSYSRTQLSLLTKAMLIAGGFFILIGLGSWGLSVAFHDVVASGYNAGLDFGIFFLILFGGMIVSFLITGAMFKDGKGSVPLIAIGYILYVAMMSTIFGYLFAIINVSTGSYIYWVAFAVTGVIFILATAMAQVMSLRGIFTMGKMIGSAAIAMGILMVVFLILGIVGICTRSTGTILASNFIFNFIMIAMAFVSFLYIVIDIWQITKTSQFLEATGQEGMVPAAFTWFCGYKLLTDLINVLLWVIILIMRYARRG